MTRQTAAIDGNHAAAHVAHRLSEVIAIYPITPSSTMGERADEWSVQGVRNIWGAVPSVTSMQSEGGAAGAVHGALQMGAMSTTFTASQGLLLMLPNMFKIAGELTPTVFHVSARTVATHALSIFGDHSDVMAARSTGFAMLASSNGQEVADLATIAHASTLEAHIPFLHFFDGFRTSHEVTKVELPSDDDLRTMIDPKLVLAHRDRGLTPQRPVLRGSAQNPDVFFQAREAANPFYRDCPDIVQNAMDRYAALVGRSYHLFDYVGAPDADRVIVMMGSGADTVQETIERLIDRGERVGLLKVRLYRPFDAARFIDALPATVRTISVLDRTKEPGATGEPLYQDVTSALMEHMSFTGNHFRRPPRVIGGRYGLSSKEFTPAMVKSVFDEMTKDNPKRHFTVGINDDVCQTSLDVDPSFCTEDDDTIRAMFYGLGSDGTVSANKNSIKIIAEGTDNDGQGYFVYDSKKAGSVTVSHLRFGSKPIRSRYLVNKANFIACHQQVFVEQFDMLRHAADGATFLLNTQASADEAWDTLTLDMQRTLIAKGMKFYVIDGYRVGVESGMGRRINTIMQTCFFAISGVLPRDEAIAKIKQAIEKTYASKGEAVVRQNFQAVDVALANLFEVTVPEHTTVKRQRGACVPDNAPSFVRDVTARMLEHNGDALPVSRMPVDGTFPTGTAKWEKRGIALEIPVWDSQTCIQCNKCVLVCPHAAIRANVFAPACLDGAPETFQRTEARGKAFTGLSYSLQVAPEDCTGCGMCVEVCPVKNKSETRLRAINMSPQAPLLDQERENYAFFLDLPEFDRTRLKNETVKDSQFMLPLFEYSGACVGCGETPYVKLVSQLFGDRAVIANATGCSSIYGGNLPTTPWTTNKSGRGPAWSNSLFEDNAEFGLGFRLAVDRQRGFAGELLESLRTRIGTELVDDLLQGNQTSEEGLAAQRARVEALKGKLRGIETPESFHLASVADALIPQSIWIIGGDGWAYDIGFGGLDHVLASGRNVNVLVLDTEVYSNTGGQMSKATPLGAVAKFAAGGKASDKKDLGAIAMSYGNVYVAQIAMGAGDAQTVKAIVEAEQYEGPSLVLAYSHCIAHGINMRKGMDTHKAAVASGHWPLYRFDPRRTLQGENPLQLDSKAPSVPLQQFQSMQNRFNILAKSHPEHARELRRQAQHATTARFEKYKRLAEPHGKREQEL